jgi:myo-inositol-1(or 4)-monophosphatase
MTQDLDERQAFGLDLAVRAGALALGMRRTLAPIEAKSAIDFCTEADRAVEQLVRAEVAQRFGDAIIGEEYGGDATDRVWVVDPIDGTAGYIHGSGRWCVSLAYVENGEIEIGVIYAPADDRLFVARRGRGATLNGRPIRVSGLAHGAAPLVEVGWSERRPLAAYCTLLQRLTEGGIEFRRNGSGALGLAEVACGLNDGYAELHINAWDALAGLLLVREAGGWTNDFLADDGLAHGNLLLAATPSISGRLVAMTQDLHRVAEPPAALAG